MNKLLLHFLFTACFLLLWIGFSNCEAATWVLQTQIEGIKDPALKNAQERLSIIQSSLPGLTPKTVQTFYNDAPHQIQQAIEPFGYFAAKVNSHLSQVGNKWIARFLVTPGIPIFLNAVEIEISGPGRHNAALETTLQSLPLHPGQQLNIATYNKTKQQLFQVANEQGYLRAHFTAQTIRINKQNHTAAIILHLATGSRYYFGPITFHQTTFDPHFLERFLGFHSGDPFSSPKLIQFQQNLSNSNYFTSVRVIPNLENETQQAVPIAVDVMANKAKQYNAGIGYGTFTGPRLTLGTNFRHLTDTGHHLETQLKLSEVLSGLTAQYVIPGQNPLTDQYTIGANMQRFMPKNGNSISKSLSLGYVKTVDPWKWATTLSYLREHYNIIGQSSHNSRIVYPTLQITRTKADDLINTHFGNKIDFTLRGANQHIVSNVSFAQAEIKGKLIMSPTDASKIIVRGDFGYTTVKDLSLLPISLQFYAGGLDSVRGFPYSYFGPGRYVKTASIEAQHRIYKKVSGAVYYDMGTADNHINAAMGRGIGVGLIYNSAIGPIKGYIGYGYLAQRPRHFAFEFSLGPDL